MDISYCTLDDVGQAADTVVVIDVLRAFTTAAVIMAGGPESYELVATLDMAYDRRRDQPGTRLVGEVDGRRPEDFDHSNSPRELLGQDLGGLRIVHRSSSGTQGVIGARQAEEVLCASFAVAGATSRLIQDLKARAVTFCITGRSAGRDGEEDRACADYIAALLSTPAGDVDPAPYVARILPSTAGQMFLDPAHDELPLADANFAHVVDRYDFALQVHNHNGRALLHVT